MRGCRQRLISSVSELEANTSPRIPSWIALSGSGGGTDETAPDREGRIVADILERFRNLVLVSTTRVSNRSSTGQAAFNSMHIAMETRGLVGALLCSIRLLSGLTSAADQIYRGPPGSDAAAA